MPKTISDPSNTTNKNIVREIRERINKLPLTVTASAYGFGYEDCREAVLEILEDYERRNGKGCDE